MTEQHCPRCGGTDCLMQPMRELTVPIEMPGFYGTHWRLCLALREPVIHGERFPVRGWLAAFRAYWRSLLALSVEQAVVPVATMSHWEMEPRSEAAGSTIRMKFVHDSPWGYSKATVKS